MRTIVAIGGGEIGRPGYPLETLSIDQDIVQLSGNGTPTVCFIPTATDDSETYIDAFERLYGGALTCDVLSLTLTKLPYTKDEILKTILCSDIVYVGGGDTSRMLACWKDTGLTEILKSEATENKVLCGLSAGAMCWFDHGASDSPMDNETGTELGLLQCLGMVPGMMCPHYDRGARRELFETIVLRQSRVGFGIDECAALVVEDQTFRVIASRDDACVHKVVSTGRGTHTERFENGYVGSVEELTI